MKNIISPLTRYSVAVAFVLSSWTVGATNYYSYTLESVNALGPQPVPWSEVQTFAGDGSILTIPLENPGSINQFYRVRIDDAMGRPGGPLPERSAQKFR